MTLTLLLDLDDTLLHNPTDQFLPAYVRALAGHLAPYILPDKMVPRLLHATDQMIAKDDSCETLKTTFDEDFYPPLGLQKDDLANVLLDFYQNKYDSLRSFTSPLPFSKTVVDFAFKKGWRVVIATNPLFPLIAVEKRLQWAGIPATDYPYALITSYESMHFAKPNPAFYAEILGQLGWQEGPVAMVGDSLQDDLSPSSSLGIPGYYLGEDHSGISSLAPGSKRGPLDEVIPWLEKCSESQPYSSKESIEGMLAILKTTPAVVKTLTSQCSRSDWRKRPIEGEWSLLEIMYHLRDLEKEVNLPRFELMENSINPFIPGVDSDRWAIERNYNEQSDTTIHADFCSSRSKLLGVIGHYSSDDWQLPLRHSFFGPTTRLELAKFIVAHDQDHIQQIVRTIQALN
jgi:FMN phosphatase YigB (HAD superfamily)